MPVLAELPAVAKRKNGDRSISLYFDLGESSSDQDPGRQYAVVSVGHSKNRKEFYAVLNQQVEQEREGPFSVMRYHPFDQISLARRPAPRFSQKALEQFALDVASQLPGWMDSNPKVAARMTEPDYEV